jgi:sporulation protein YlmC with PRC-barrel domain
MLFSEANGRKVVSTSTAETVGQVAGFVVDPHTRTVVAVEVKKAAGDTLAWADIFAFGADAVTVTGAERIGEATADVAALSGKEHRMLGKRVLSSAGDELGKVDDVDFEPESGQVVALLVTGDQIAGGRLIGVGSYAVVVNAQ